MNSIADDIYADLVDTIAKGPRQRPGGVRATIDDGPFLASQARAAGLVDELRYEDEMFGELKTALHQSELKKVSEQRLSERSRRRRRRAGPDRFRGGRKAPSRAATPIRTARPASIRAFDKMLAKVGNDCSVKARDRAHRFAGRRSHRVGRHVARHERAPEAEAGGDFDVRRGGFRRLLHGDVGRPDRGLSGDRNRLDRGGFRQAQSARAVRQGRHYQGLREPRPFRADRFRLPVAFRRRRARSCAKASTPTTTISWARSRRRGEEAVPRSNPWRRDASGWAIRRKRNGLVDELGGIDRAVELIKQKAGIPAASQVNLVLYPAQAQHLRSAALSERRCRCAGGRLLSRRGPRAMRAAWHDARLRVWMRGGMLRMMPFAIEFRCRHLSGADLTPEHIGRVAQSY